MDAYIEQLIAKAEELGFSHAGPVNMEALVPRDEVRDMCRADVCKSYNKSWSCPPACCSIEEARELLSRYHRGILVQTTVKMKHDFDIKSVLKAMPVHQANLDKLADYVREEHPDCLPMGAGACTHCKECTYPDAECRFPDKMVISMEAYGLVVTDACRDSNMEYNYGPQTTTYISCLLID